MTHARVVFNKYPITSAHLARKSRGVDRQGLFGEDTITRVRVARVLVQKFPITRAQRLRKHGFELVSVAEPDLMANDPTRILVRQMMGAVAQYEKSQIVLKLRGARMRKRAKEGRCEGRKPYGYFEGEQTVVARMSEPRNTGMGFDRIAAQLNAEGVKPCAGERWHGLVVNRILTGKR
jgi:hypothetical protein